MSEIFFILVTIGCGGSSSENCTYFEVSSLTTTGACSGKICKLSSDICQVSIHSRMRGQSSGLVTAADKIPAIGVLFAVDYDVIVRKPCFQRGTTLKFLKYFRTLFFF